MRVILGSQSPRRREILQFFSIPLVATSSDFDESKVSFTGDVNRYVQEIAEKKGEALLKAFPTDVVITADTVVVFEKEILLKPSTDEEARKTLKKLSGKSHLVVSGVSVRKGEKVYSGADTTLVTFNELSDRQIETYIKGAHGQDKAGSYGIQERGSLLVKRIEGCFYNVVGLPVNTLNALLKQVGIDLWDAISS
ncbi:MAG: nucleoside triphosphate pyrophosphatase [Simkaniaceae bacterium]|jgi:septum formation protein